MSVPSSLIGLLAVLASFVRVVQAVPMFHIDLDLRPEIRWKEVAEYYMEKMPYLFKVVEERTSRQLGDSRQDWLDSVQYCDEHLAELQGFVDAIGHPQVTLDLLKLWNAIYELESPVMCSATLEALQNGTVYHGRNMDYSFTFTMPDGRLLNLPDVTFDVIFYKEGVPLIQATTWPGIIGIHTGMRLGPGGYTFDQQTRGTNKWEPNLAAAKKGGVLFMPGMRRIMEATATYSDAVDKAYQSSWMAPQYFVMAGAGPYEGASITIDRLGAHEPETPLPQKLGQDRWHLVQTNDDLNHPAKDIRRPDANRLLNKMSQTNAEVDQLTRFMHEPPLFDVATVFTTIMVPGTGFYKTILPDEPPFFMDPKIERPLIPVLADYLVPEMLKVKKALHDAGGSGKLQLTQSRARRLRRQP